VRMRRTAHGFGLEAASRPHRARTTMVIGGGVPRTPCEQRSNRVRSPGIADKPAYFGARDAIRDPREIGSERSDEVVCATR
jgi:hypothetical protein